jgi:3-deoxy-manno-octulosonate cytidylyltransferase (CMP-KDO synthetase)
MNHSPDQTPILPSIDSSHTSETAVLIPARFASSRLKEKMLHFIAGKPLIQWTYERACEEFASSNIHILTDDLAIYSVAKTFNAQVWMTPQECESGTARINWALNHDLNFLQAKWIIGLQGDEPLIDMKAVRLCLKALQDHPDAVLSTLSTPISPTDFQNPNIVKCVSDRYERALYFSRSPIPNPGNHKKCQEMPLRAKRHVGIYIWQKDFIKDSYQRLEPSFLHQSEDLEQLKLLEAGYRIQIAHWPYPIAPGIDTYEEALATESMIMNSTSLATTEERL